MSGGIVQKKKRSQSKKRIRHATWQKKVLDYWTKKLNLGVNKTTGNVVRGHRVDKKTGYYGDKQVMTVKSKEQILDADA